MELLQDVQFLVVDDSHRSMFAESSDCTLEIVEVGSKLSRLLDLRWGVFLFSGRLALHSGALFVQFANTALLEPP